MARQLRRALRSTRTVELRLDWLKSDKERLLFIGWLRLHAPRATLLATCRGRRAGGRFAGGIPKQMVFLQMAALSGCAWCDLEIETAALFRGAELKAFLGRAGLLVSYHDFHGTPRNLGEIVRRLERCGGDAVKLATQCHSLADSRRVLALARSHRRIVVVPMGEAGLPGRVLALREGSALAYAPVEAATAPGQLSLDQMKHLYRADQLNRRTRIYGVIGDPIGHSLSPLLHNAGFQARRMNAVYLHFRVRELRDFLRMIGPLGIAGFSVTLPHKQRILDCLDDCDPLASQIGAVNTIVVRGDRKLYGYNTDYVGVLRALERRVRLAGSRVLLYGAGGAARAVAFALARAGAVVCISARRREKARALAQAVGGEEVERRRLKREFFDAIVNATPVGMHPDTEYSPLEAAELNCRMVMDLIYRPRKTLLLQRAERRGIETLSGVEMFVAQGTAQWEIWTGLRAPVVPMRRAVLAALRAEEKSSSER